MPYQGTLALILEHGAIIKANMPENPANINVSGQIGLIINGYVSEVREEKMETNRYTLPNLRQHTETIRAQSSARFEEQFSALDQAFNDFDDFISSLEAQPVSLERNVKMMLTCKFLNHVYSGVILAERGLITDAVVCERTALETLAFYRLICLDPTAIREYDNEEMPRPVEVRRRLESLGAQQEVDHIRELYSSSSEILHVSRSSEQFHSTWDSASEGNLLIGGSFSPTDQEQMLRFFFALLYWFHQPLDTTPAT